MTPIEKFSQHWLTIAGVFVSIMYVGHMTGQIEQASADIQQIKGEHVDVIAAKVDQMSDDIKWLRDNYKPVNKP